MHKNDLDMIQILKIGELAAAYCPPDRQYGDLECASCGLLSHCIDCWIEWFGDAVKMKGD